MKKITNNRNPLLPLDVHIPDGEPHVMPDGKLYVYGSYDGLGDLAYCSQEYHVVSTADLNHWTVHDTSFSTVDVPWLGQPDLPVYPQAAPDWMHPTPFLQKMIQRQMEGKSQEELMEMAKQAQEAAQAAEHDGDKNALLFAPDCISRDGKYYLYFCLHNGDEGVAVSDRPEGPFGEARRLPCGGIDPAIFIDDDGKAYYYWGPITSCGVCLNDDMVSFDRENIVENLVTEEKHYFHEGSSMRKIGDTYYYVYADMERGKPTALGYSTSKSPLGPFTYRGIIVDNADCDPQSWNNHGSIECIDGQWCVFYHRSTRNSDKYRRMCAEKITVLPDGTIPEMKMTSQGLGDPFAPGEKIMAYQACGLRGKAYIDAEQTENAPGTEQEDGQSCMEKITNICPGDEMIFRYIRGTNTYTGAKITARGKGSLEIYLDDVLVGEIAVNGNAAEESSVRLENVEEFPVKEQGYEVRLRCKEAEELELLEICFLA